MTNRDLADISQVFSVDGNPAFKRDVVSEEKESEVSINEILELGIMDQSTYVAWAQLRKFESAR